MGNKEFTIALFGNCHQSKKSIYTGLVIRHLTDRNVNVVIEEDFYNHIHATMGITCNSEQIINSKDFSADIAISMGGDGTFLKTAQMVGAKELPILGINIGHLGFMAEVTPEEISRMIDNIVDNNFSVEERSVLEVISSQGNIGIYPYALNEVAVLKQDISSMIQIKAEVDGTYLTTYMADGLIVSTPTGSTGYSLSVGGPILSPNSPVVVISPVAPHSLNVRPIVLLDNVKVKLKVEGRSKGYLLSVDGRSERREEDEELTIRKATYKIRIIKNDRKSYFDSLREKLMWGTDLRN